MTPKDLSTLLGLSGEEISALLAGNRSITVSMARSLAETLGGSPDFWIARDAQYLDDCARVAADRWASDLPIKQMVDFGWIKQPADWHERMDRCLNFFSIDNVLSYEENYGSIIDKAQYRTSPKYTLEKTAAATWFRACEISANRIKTPSEYNAASFCQSLQTIRGLTRIKQPEIFIPQLVEICASCGVLVTLVRAPDGFPVSGAARMYQGHPLIQLSARFLSDDHLWFTLFHEAAHVLIHALDEPFVDIEDSGDSNSVDIFESEANQHARRTLLDNYALHAGPYSHREVVSIATKLGVSPGIIVGQLQYEGYVPRNYLNRLKRRYVWRGTSLEMAQRN